MIATLRVLVATLVLATAGVALHRWTWVPLRCTGAASTGRIALEDAAAMRGDAQRRVARRVQSELANCDCVRDFAIPLTRGDAARMAGEPRIAIAEYQRALRIDRRPATYFRLGLAQLEAFDRRSAIDSLVRACTYHPALLAEIPYDDVRAEVRRVVVGRFGEAWLR